MQSGIGAASKRVQNVPLQPLNGIHQRGIYCPYLIAHPCCIVRVAEVARYVIHEANWLRSVLCRALDNGYD